MLRVSSQVQSSALGFKNKTCLSYCQQLVASSHHSSHLLKCSHASAAPPILPLLHVQGADPSVSLPTFDSVCKKPGRTVRHIPVKDKLVFAHALCSALHDNCEDAWLKVFMPPKCVLAPKRGLTSQACAYQSSMLPMVQR